MLRAYNNGKWHNSKPGSGGKSLTTRRERNEEGAMRRSSIDVEVNSLRSITRVCCTVHGVHDLCARAICVPLKDLGSTSTCRYPCSSSLSLSCSASCCALTFPLVVHVHSVFVPIVCVSYPSSPRLSIRPGRKLAFPATSRTSSAVLSAS